MVSKKKKKPEGILEGIDRENTAALKDSFGNLVKETSKFVLDQKAKNKLQAEANASLEPPKEKPGFLDLGGPVDRVLGVGEKAIEVVQTGIEKIKERTNIRKLAEKEGSGDKFILGEAPAISLSPGGLGQAKDIKAAFARISKLQKQVNTLRTEKLAAQIGSKFGKAGSVVNIEKVINIAGKARATGIIPLLKNVGKIIVGGTIAQSLMVTWLASDNIITGFRFTSNNIVAAVEARDINQSQANEEFEEMQSIKDGTTSFVNRMTMINPLMWAFRKQYMINADVTQTDLDLKKLRIDNFFLTNQTQFERTQGEPSPSDIKFDEQAAFEAEQQADVIARNEERVATQDAINAARGVEVTRRPKE